jgi:hypothetical protein
MKRKTKKNISISLVLLLAVALFAWYFYPFYMFRWLFYRNDSLRKYLEVTPVEITALKPPPQEWNTIAVGGLTLMLPMSKYKNVQGKASYLPYLYCTSERGSLLITDIVPPREILKLVKEKKLRYPAVSYQEELAILKSTPADISFFNSRSKNERASANQVLKAIDVPLYRFTKILAVNTGVLKAICTFSEKQEKGYTARVQAFNQNEAMSFTFMLKDYKEIALLESDVFGILAGIRMPDHIPDPEEVEKDIKSIVTKFNGRT